MHQKFLTLLKRPLRECLFQMGAPGCRKAAHWPRRPTDCGHSETQTHTKDVAGMSSGATADKLNCENTIGHVLRAEADRIL